MRQIPRRLSEARKSAEVDCVPWPEFFSWDVGFQAQCLNVHVDFPLIQRMALPVTLGSVRYPGIKIQVVGPNLTHYQNPGHPHYPVTGGFAPRRHYRRRLVRQTDS
jgi:hypothetical protein